MENRQKLPTGQQDFVTIRNEGLAYVDKTAFIEKLMREKMVFLFLSKPRRFGKSLFLNTLKEVLLGNRHLFEGLYIEDKIVWETTPVLHFDFSKMGFKNLGLDAAIATRLKKIADETGLVLETDGIALQFQELIEKLHAKTGKKVAILVDEYDKPITEYIEFGGKVEEQRDVLRNFYGILKGSSAHIRMVFVTGISRFAKVSLFSDMNNFTDLSFHKDYHDICGYTKEDLETVFSAHLDRAAEELDETRETLMEKVREWYNGYSWDGKRRVYNPFSILRFLDTREFGNYWFESGTPKFLLKLLKPGFRYELNGLKVDMAIFDNHDVDSLNTETLLFQTGYLTIKEKDFAGRFVLGYPNREVEQSMMRNILMDYSQNQNGSALAINFIEAVHEGDMQKFMDTADVLFASIPGEIFLQNREAYFHSVLFTALKLCGFHIEAEVRKSKGRIDAVMRHQNTVFIFEFKLDGTPAEALAQIESKGYADAYKGQDLIIRKIGISFSSETKAVGDWDEAGKVKSEE